MKYLAKQFITTAIFSGVIIFPAQSQNSDLFANAKSVYYDEKVLSESIADISSMNSSELRLFSRYLAECSDESITDIAGHACNAAEQAYSLEFGQFVGGKPVRALDRFIIAWGSLMRRPASVKAKDIDFTNTHDVVEDAVRVAKITFAIHQAVRTRYHDLRTAKK